MNCIVIDDEYLALKQMEKYILQTPSLKLEKSFRSSLSALNYLKNSVDLIFLDIDMPDLNGMELLQALAKPPLVIITTAYSEYALESYDYQVVDYLLKPIEFPRFLKATDKALKLFQSNKDHDEKKHQDSIFVQSGTELHQIKLKEIIYIEGAGNYLYIHTVKKKIMTLLTLKEMEKLLITGPFIRVHKSYIVNLEYIESIEHDHIIFNDIKIPVGKYYKENFYSLIKNNNHS
ncbi:MAG: response regulator transcription factor [Desulfobacterales bacterium]|nr:response regulator transcription factor [Desulfobacterales bacterium]